VNNALVVMKNKLALYALWIMTLYPIIFMSLKPLSGTVALKTVYEEEERQCFGGEN
jgi:hypothetical protein